MGAAELGCNFPKPEPEGEWAGWRWRRGRPGRGEVANFSAQASAPHSPSLARSSRSTPSPGTRHSAQPAGSPGMLPPRQTLPFLRDRVPRPRPWSSRARSKFRTHLLHHDFISDPNDAPSTHRVSLNVIRPSPRTLSLNPVTLLLPCFCPQITSPLHQPQSLDPQLLPHPKPKTVYLLLSVGCPPLLRGSYPKGELSNAHLAYAPGSAAALIPRKLWALAQAARA